MAIYVAAAWNQSATWNGSAAATCRAPAWGRKRWASPPDAAVLSSLPFAFLVNGVDAAALSPPLAYTHFDQALSAVAPRSGPRAGATSITVYGRGLSVHTDEAQQPHWLARESQVTDALSRASGAGHVRAPRRPASRAESPAARTRRRSRRGGPGRRAWASRALLPGLRCVARSGDAPQNE